MAYEKKYTEDSYVSLYLNGDRHDHRFIRRFGLHTAFGGFVLILLSLSALLPRRCPIRFDRHKEIAYTWDKGKLYIADIGPQLGGLNTRLGSSRPDTPLLERDKTTGPVVITQFEANNPQNKQAFRIGP